MYIWEVAAFLSWGSCHLVNCHLEKFTFVKLPVGKIAHLGSCHLENYPGEVAAWEKAFGKVPNI